MQKRWYTFSRAGVAAAGILIAGSMFAAVPALAAGEPGVARLGEVSGSVAIRHGDSGATFAAAPNAPLLVGDYLSTGDDSRAEVQYDYGNVVRVASNTQVRFTDLDPTRHIAQLAGGTVDLRVMHVTDARPEIDTPSLPIRTNEAGSYRITVQEDGTTLVTARSGQADLLTPQGVRTLDAGTTLLVQGPPDNPQISQVDVVGYDAFDQWGSQRDSFDGDDTGYQYTSNTIPGVADLNQYGTWVDNSQYGESWVPNNVPAGWAPYQNGQWSWEPNYGYTWVSNEPWGWAPYHYGNWFYDNGNNNWAWQPSPQNSAANWLPAVVGFLGMTQNGGGSDVLGLLSQFANVGWFPLAPGEQYTPWYGGYGQTGVNPYYGYNLPVSNNYYQPYSYEQIIQVYRNVRIPGAVAYVPASSFANGGVVRVRHITIRNFHDIVIVRHVIPVLPAASAQRFTTRTVELVGIAPKPALFKRFPAMRTQPQAFASERAHLVTVSRKVLPSELMPMKRLTPAEAPASAPREQPATVPHDQPATAPREQPAVTPREQPAVAPREQPVAAPREQTQPVQRPSVPRHLETQQNAPPPVVPRHVRPVQPDATLQSAPQRPVNVERVQHPVTPDRLQRPANPARFQPAAQRPVQASVQRAPRSQSVSPRHARPDSKPSGNDKHQQDDSGK